MTPEVEWRVRGSYFEACNCDAICPCRSAHGQPGGPSTHGECYGTLSWQVHEGAAGAVDLEHVAPRKRIDVVGYLLVEAEGEASDPGDVRCGIPGFDHPGTELFADMIRSNDPVLRWEVRGNRNAAFTTEFEYRSD